MNKKNSVDFFMNALIDASRGMQYLINSAKDFELGICLIILVKDYLVEVNAICRLPEGIFYNGRS